MKLSFLEAKEPLTKSYGLDSEGLLTKSSYPVVKNFKSHSYQITKIEELYALLSQHAAEGHCLLKGTLQRDLEWEPRAGSTNRDLSTELIVLDLDLDLGYPTPQAFMAALSAKYTEFAEVSYIVQYSASYMVHSPTHLKCHIFLLSTQADPLILKNRLKQINLEMFSTQIKLAKSNVALIWPLDISVAQNDKLIYIAEPQLNDGVNYIGPNPRITLVKGLRNEVLFTPNTFMPAIPPADEVRQSEVRTVNTLRQQLGLTERRKYELKRDGIQEYLPIAAGDSTASITGIREERGFVYLNLNGGDSWAYYHAKNNHKYIFNFKGEPTYLTEELLPEYYYECQKAAQAAYAANPFQSSQAPAGNQSNANNSPNSRLYLAFRDLPTSGYYNGWFDQATNELTLYPARSKDQLGDFLRQYGLPEPDYYTDWTLEYDPTVNLTSYQVINNVTRTINTFRPTQYMMPPNQFAKTVSACPPGIKWLLDNVIGTNPDIHNHWHNWLAFILRHRQPTRTAWLTHGVEGTGKGVLFNHILTTLFGYDNVVMKRAEEIEEKYNDWIEGKLIVFIDEADMSERPNKKNTMANIKNMIVEPFVSMRKMFATGKRIKNFSNFMFASNMTAEPITISASDRRFNLGDYQRVPLRPTDAQIKQLQSEVADYANFLHNWQIDYVAVHVPIRTEAREKAIANSKNSIDMIADMIREGDIMGLYDSLPVNTSHLDIAMQAQCQQYKQVMWDLIETRRNKISREELQIIFTFNVGRNTVPNSPAKFTRFCGHHDLHIEPLSIDGHTTRGYKLDKEWTASDEWWAQRDAEINVSRNKPILKAVS